MILFKAGFALEMKIPRSISRDEFQQFFGPKMSKTTLRSIKGDRIMIFAKAGFALKMKFLRSISSPGRIKR